MKHKELILFSLLTFTSYVAISQTVINIKESNTLTTKELREAQSITFSERNLNLNLTSGDVLSFALSNVRRIDFGTSISSIDDQKSSKENTTKIFPNPSNGNQTLNLIFKSELQSQLNLTIYALNGAIKNQWILAPNEDSIYPFQLLDYQSGMYIAVIQQGGLIKTTKFIIK